VLYPGSSRCTRHARHAQRPQDDVDRLARVAVSESFIAGLPKVELHVHHVGSVPLRAVAELAARHPGTVPSDLDELARYFIFDVPADFGVPAAELTASVALDHDVPGLVGFGLGGTDRGFPRSMFRDQFDRARAAGLRSVPHAGETTGPESVWDALVSLGAERIEHGIAAVGDPRLLEHLVEHKIALDICLTSNVALRVVPDLDHHPIRELVANGVTVTINTDDPPMVGADLNTEYATAARLLDLDEQGVTELALAAVDASFASRETKDALRSEINSYAAMPAP